MNKVQSHFKTTGQLLLISLMLISSFQCVPANRSGQNTEYDNMKTTDRKVEIRGTYQLSIPHNYEVQSGIGDDTEFVQIRSEAGDIVIGYEAGVEDAVFEPNDANTLKTKFENLKNIKELPEEKIWIGYRQTEAKFRNMEGKVYIEQNTALKEILRFSCSSTQLDNTIQILSTIQLLKD